MAAGLAANTSVPSRRSPMNNGKRPLFAKQANTGPLHGSGRSGFSCARGLRWALPCLLAAVLSSYLAYLLLFAGHVSHRIQHGQGHHGSLSYAALPGSDSAGSSHMASSQQAPGGASQPAAGLNSKNTYSPQDAAIQWFKQTGRQMRVAVVNDAPYHLEIVAGLLQVLSSMPVDVTWYQAGQTTADGTLTAAELVDVTGFTQLLGFLPHMEPRTGTPAPCDFAIMVSPEYFLPETKAFLDAAKPVTALVLAHNGMNKALQNIQAFHPRLHFAALSPHVAAAARHALHIHTHWILPTFTFTSKAPCTVDSTDASTCMNGFSIQGNFEAARRNYTRLWLQVEHAMAAGAVPTEPPARPFNLHLVGRGNVSTLKMPAAVEKYTTVHFNLKFSDYYDQLQHTHALLMLLGNINYLVQKMSSTVVSSLMTGVPIIADSNVLASYTFLKPEHIFLMGPHETEMDVMQRVVRMSPTEVFNVRQRVLALQQHLNKRAFLVLQAFMPAVHDVAAAPTLQ